MQLVVRGFAVVMNRVMGASGAESLNVTYRLEGLSTEKVTFEVSSPRYSANPIYSRELTENEKKDGDKQDPGEQKQEAPGEADPNQELTPEQKQKLMKQLQEFEKQLQQLRAAQKAQRPRVKKDW